MPGFRRRSRSHRVVRMRAVPVVKRPVSFNEIEVVHLPVSLKEQGNLGNIRGSYRSQQCLP